MLFIQQQQQQGLGSMWYVTTNCFFWGLEAEAVYYKMTDEGFHSRS